MALSAGKAICQDVMPGLYSQFQKTLLNQEKLYSDLIAKHADKSFSMDDVKDAKDIKLNQTFLNIFIFNLPSRYQVLLKKDECSVYDVLITKLSKIPYPKNRQVVFDYKSKKGSIQTAVYPFKKFFDEIVSQQCPGVMKISKNFDLKNLPVTLRNLKLKIPNNLNQCLDLINQMQSQATTPYLCHITETIEDIPNIERKYKNTTKTSVTKRKAYKQELDRANAYKNLLNSKVTEVLTTTCRYLNNPWEGCSNLFYQNYWRYLAENDPSSAALKTFCQDLPQKSCLNKLKSLELFCPTQLNKYSSISPSYTCRSLQYALRTSRVKSNYIDCPGKTGNEALTTFSRLLKHFQFYDQEAVSSCEVHSINPTLKFLEEFTELEGWGLKVCYDDKIKRKEVCYPVMFGDAAESDFSLTNVIGKIALRLKGYNYQDAPCEIINQSEYRPALLKYQNGCFILRDENFCRGVDCDFKVIISEQEFKSFKVKKDLQLALYPHNYINEGQSLTKLLEKNKKFNVKKVENISRFKILFDQKKNILFMGIGCAEDLIPSFFHRNFVNKCTALPFIVDNLVEHEGKYAMTVRSSFDHIHAPRLIPWTYIFNAVKEYQRIHPINLWSFNAFYP